MAVNIAAKLIAYVGPFRFPEGEAGASRVKHIARALAAAGHNLIIAGGKPDPVTPEALPGQDSSERPIDYIGIGEILPTGRQQIRKYFRGLFTYGARTLKWLDAQASPPQAIILYGGYSPFLFRLLPWCRKRHVPLIADIVEWYDGHHVLGGLFGLYHLNYEIAMRWLYPQCTGVIAISSFLERYYQQKGCKTVRIPPTLDVRAIAWRDSARDIDAPLKLAYTGVPGKKDLLNNVIEAVLQANASGLRVILTVAGPTPAVLLRMPALQTRGMQQLPDGIVALGRVSNHEAIELVRQADFTVLLRQPLRYAQAGFPTKVPESLAVGTPVICNLTSDLGDYIHHGQEGIICKDHSPEAFTTALQHALAITSEHYQAMRQAARSQAEKSFDYRVYTESLNAFLHEVYTR